MLNEGVRSLVQEFADGIMNELPPRVYFLYTPIHVVKSAVPVSFGLRYDENGAPGPELENA